MGRFLIVAGIVLILVGVLVKLGVPIGRLPGDIVMRRGSSTFYFPVVTCILASLILSLVALWLRR